MTNSETQYHSIGYQGGLNGDPLLDLSELMCFEDVYLSARMGLWMQGRRNLVTFRKDTVAISEEPILLSDANETLHIDKNGFDDTKVDGDKKMPYCGVQSKGRSSARIKIFERTATIMLRRFINLEEVLYSYNFLSILHAYISSPNTMGTSDFLPTNMTCNVFS